ncbi:MAG: DUF1194 domain-containing protein [Pseudomonadota bacterium]
MRYLMVVALLMVGQTMSADAQEAQRVDLELVLLADATGSIDDAEIRFQRQGYAAAITDPEILSAIAQGFDKQIAVTFIEFGDYLSQETVVPWTIIGSPESAKAFADELLATPRKAYGRNAIGAALDTGRMAIEDNAIEGYRKVIDISADSANNWNGPTIPEARQRALDADITINGLAILCRHCSGRPSGYDLEEAFSRTIIGGPASFVVTADGDTSFTEAVRRKLLLEIAGRTPSRRERFASNSAD